MIKSINFVVLGEQSIANDFGKKGTVTDLSLYDKKESDIIRTWVVPTGFPDKIQPLFQAINLTEYVILYLGSLDKFTGEQIVALDLLRKKEGSSSSKTLIEERVDRCDVACVCSGAGIFASISEIICCNSSAVIEAELSFSVPTAYPPKKVAIAIAATNPLSIFMYEDFFIEMLFS